MFNENDLAYIRAAIPAGHTLENIEADETQLVLHVLDTETTEHDTISIAKHHVPTTVNWLVLFEEETENLLNHVLYRMF